MRTSSFEKEVENEECMEQASAYHGCFLRSSINRGNGSAFHRSVCNGRRGICRSHFPAVMEEMLHDAEDVHQKIRLLDERLSTIPSEGTLEELEQSLQEVATIELERSLLVSEFSSIAGEIAAYSELIPSSEADSYLFLSDGFSRIQEMKGNVSSSLLEEVRASIQNGIEQLEENSNEGVDEDENHEGSL